MSEVLSWSEIKQMSLDELIENEARLPEEMDVSTLTEENIRGFRLFVEFVEEEEERVKTLGETLTSQERTAYNIFGYSSIPPIVGIHEGIHAIAAELTGSNVTGAGFWKMGAYVDIDFTSKVSEALTVWAPNIVLPTVGFALMRHGLQNKKYGYLGVGVAATFMNAESFLIDIGDYSLMTQYIFPGAQGAPLVALGAAVTFANYFLAYKLSFGLDYMRDKLVNLSSNPKNPEDASN